MKCFLLIQKADSFIYYQVSKQSYILKIHQQTSYIRYYLHIIMSNLSIDKSELTNCGTTLHNIYFTFVNQSVKEHLGFLLTQNLH